MLKSWNGYYSFLRAWPFFRKLFVTCYLFYSRIVCLSSPTAYKKIREIKPNTVTVKCLEYDTRFHIYGEDFVFYDYKEPLKFPEEWKKSFDIVIADPPFLSEECLCNTAVSIKYLAQDKIILCTGNYC
jgi:16S rRNA G966 N2-methylase RsmD